MIKAGYAALNSSGVLISERGFLFLPCSCSSIGQRAAVKVSFSALSLHSFFPGIGGGRFLTSPTLFSRR
jgi:hypothetical protein